MCHDFFKHQVRENFRYAIEVGEDYEVPDTPDYDHPLMSWELERPVCDMSMTIRMEQVGVNPSNDSCLRVEEIYIYKPHCGFSQFCPLIFN